MNLDGPAVKAKLAKPRGACWHRTLLVTPEMGDSQCTTKDASFGSADATSCKIREHNTLDCFRLHGNTSPTTVA